MDKMKMDRGHSLKRKAVKVGLVLLALIIVTCTSGVFYMTRGIEEGRRLEISAVEPSALADGTYEGSYDGGRWSNTVSVTIKDGKIIDIDVVRPIRGADAIWEGLSGKLFGRVIQAQNTTVDVFSGATVSSKAYLKSIENALTQK
jgi:uncharacterized protein with FMN-binding domain